MLREPSFASNGKVTARQLGILGVEESSVTSSKKKEKKVV